MSGRAADKRARGEQGTPAGGQQRAGAAAAAQVAQRRHRPPVTTAPVALARGAARLGHSQVTNTGDGERQLQQLFFPGHEDTKRGHREQRRAPRQAGAIHEHRRRRRHQHEPLQQGHGEQQQRGRGYGEQLQWASGSVGTRSWRTGGAPSSAVAIGCAWPARARPVAVACVHVRLGWL